MKTPLVITRATTSPSIEAAFASRFNTPNQSSSRRSMEYKPGVFFGRQDDLAHYEQSAKEYAQRQEGIPTVIRMTITPENFSFAAGVLTQPYNAGEGNRYGYMAFNTYEQMEEFDRTVMAARPD
ncbi:MAG TPA: hypothetical protein VFQ63_04420, partial [Patescibacteria group bacterium]|nr:hypothetical protein [Patescibacteria group bacterium]